LSNSIQPQVALSNGMNEALLTKSFLLHEALAALYESAAPYPGQRFNAAMDTCAVSFEHASSVLHLVAAGLPSSATALLRVQTEAVTRAMWLLYAATDADVELMLSELDVGTSKAVKKLPMMTDMLRALEKTAPPIAVRPLLRFKELSVDPMNSFVHSGVHPLQRQRGGFPVALIEQVVKSSNGLTTICGMTAAVLTGDVVITRKVRALQSSFASVLPPLEGVVS
jgi:hypothetical protein